MLPRRRKQNLTQRIRNKNIFGFLGSNLTSNFWKKITSNLVLHSVKLSIKDDCRIKTASYMQSLKFYLLWESLFRQLFEHMLHQNEGNSRKRTEKWDPETTNTRKGKKGSIRMMAEAAIRQQLCSKSREQPLQVRTGWETLRKISPRERLRRIRRERVWKN